MALDYRALSDDQKGKFLSRQRRLIEDRYEAFRRSSGSEGCTCACGSSPVSFRKHILFPILAGPDTLLLPVLGRSALSVNGFRRRTYSTTLGLIPCVKLVTTSRRRRGSGPALILCSGLASKLTDHFSLLIQLAKRRFFRFVAIVDIPGHAMTAQGVQTEGRTLSLATATQSLGEAVEQLMNEDGLEDRPVFLLGLSMGARLVLELASQRAMAPTPRTLAIAGVVIVCPLGAPFSVSDQAKLQSIYEVETYAQAKLITQQSGAFSDRRAKLEVVANAATFRRMRKPGVRALIRSDIMTTPISPSALEALTRAYPFCGLFGGKDGIIPPEAIEYFAEHVAAAPTSPTAAEASGLPPTKPASILLVPELTHNNFVFPGQKDSIDAVVAFCNRVSAPGIGTAVPA